MRTPPAYQSPPCGGIPQNARTSWSIRGVSPTLTSDTISNLGGGFPLRCFQRLSVGNLVTQRCRKISTTGTPGIPSSQSSRTRDESPQISTVVLDRDRAVLRRSEPSSRTALTGEQPDPWELLHPQDAMSRHRDSPTGECTLVLPRVLTIPSPSRLRSRI